MLENKPTYRLALAEEAPRIAQFVADVYCNNYPSDLLANPERMAALMQKELLFCSIALNERGDICGHLAMLYEDLAQLTVDSMAATVAESARANNMMIDLSGPLLEVCIRRGTIGMHQYATSVHDISQRKIAENGGCTTGVLLADWPGNLEVSGFSAGAESKEHCASTPFVAMYFPFLPFPARQVYLPEAYASLLATLYEELPGERELRFDAGVVRSNQSEYRLTQRPLQGVAILRLRHIGSDFKEYVAELSALHSQFNALYIDIALDSAAASVVVDYCRVQNWFYGCLLPERHGTDFLRLQKTPIKVQRDSVALWQSAESLFEFTVRDQEQLS